MTDAPKTKRKRNSEATRQALIDAARKLFGQKGYDRVGLREISHEAGVNIALINRYFGSKKGLFEAAIPSTVTAGMLADIPTNQFAKLTAQITVNKSIHPVFDPTLALIRSAGAEEINASLREALERKVIETIAKKLGGPDAKACATLIISTLLGYDLLVRTLGVTTLKNSNLDRLQSILEQQINTLIQTSNVSG